jgi:hypothetical protein
MSMTVISRGDGNAPRFSVRAWRSLVLFGYWRSVLEWTDYVLEDAPSLGASRVVQCLLRLGVLSCSLYLVDVLRNLVDARAGPASLTFTCNEHPHFNSLGSTNSESLECIHYL